MPMRILIALLLLAAATPPLAAQRGASPADIYRQVQHKYANATSVQLRFATSETPEEWGTLTVKRGNKFIVELPDRIIYCDGTTMWNYSPGKNKVIISTFKPASGAVSPQQIFLDFPTNYAPTLLRESSSSGERFTTLVLKPRSAGAMVGGLRAITLRLSPTSLDIEQVVIDDGMGARTWLVNNIETDVEAPDEMFTFQTGGDDRLRVIDLR